LHKTEKESNKRAEDKEEERKDEEAGKNFHYSYWLGNMRLDNRHSIDEDGV